MHASAFNFVQHTAAYIGRVASVLEIGSRNVNGSVRDVFPPSTRYLGTDIAPGPGVDIVADGATVTIAEPVDLVVCCEVLEHTADARRIVARALTLLPTNGHLVITCAAPDREPHSAIDGGVLRVGEYYANVTPDLLLLWIQSAGGQIRRLVYSRDLGDVYVWARKL